MARSFQDKLVLITGASAGIGRESALRFAAAGATVLAVARSTERLRELAQRAPGPGRVVPLQGDVADAASMERMTRQVLDGHGVPDVVVANAGIGLDARLSETSDELLREVFEVNVFGVVRTIRPFLNPMVERGSGRVLLVSSVVGKRGIPHYAAYSASKHALHGLAESLRTELWDTGVSVGVVCPSSTESEFHARKRRSGPAQHLPRVARHSTASVARAIVRLAGSRRRELVLSAEGKAMSWLNRLWPGLLDVILARLFARRASD